VTAAPIPAADLETALAPFGRSTVLPAAAYTSPAVLAWELRNFFAGTWSCLGRLDELRATGATFAARTVGDVPVLLSFDDPAGLGAFANTCRHRGHELVGVDQSTTTRSLVCPYHAWTYDSAGRLLQAPGFRDVDGFDPGEHGLVRLPVEEWHGWVFVNATADADPFEAHLGSLDDLVRPYVPERLVVRATSRYEVAANWKVVTENYHECYHCPLIHPELCRVSPPTSGRNHDLPGRWVGGSMDLRDAAMTMSLDGRSPGPAIDGVDPRTVQYLGLFPDLLLSLHPDYLLTHRLVPTAPDRTLVECQWLFPDGDVDPGFAVDFWDTTNRQDWAACESVQRGLASPHYRPGPLAPNEDAVHQFVSLVANGYLER
jgi:Rieske 2Fe-2S family protein